MARRKNVKRIDPRYFLHETVNRGEELEEPRRLQEDGAGYWYAGKEISYEQANRYATQDCRGSFQRAEGSAPSQRCIENAMNSMMQPPAEKKLDEDQSIFAPNHYCVHHGGVQHEGQIKMAEAINHNYDRKLNRVTHYDMRLQDGTVLEGVPAEDIQVVRASLAEEHSHEGGCPSEEGDVASDISQLSPEEAFEAGMAAARDAIDQALGAPDGPPPEGELQ